MYSFERCTTTRTELPSDHSALLKVLSHRYGLAVENLCCVPKGELAYSYVVECEGVGAIPQVARQCLRGLQEDCWSVFGPAWSGTCRL